MIIKKISVYCANIIFGLPQIIFLLTIKPFIKVRIGRLYSSRIGHLIYNIDNYISNSKKINNHHYSIFICEDFICNTTVFALWNKRKDLLLTKNFFLKNLIGFLEKFFPKSFILINHSEVHPEFSLVSCSERNIDIEEENKKTRVILSDLNLDNPYICLHNRDSEYLKYKNLSDINDDYFRNFSFSDYEIAFQKMTNDNISFVRIGETTSNNYLSNKYRIVDATGQKHSNENIVQVVNGSKFIVTGNSGIAQVSRILRKPQLFINYIPFKIEDFGAWSAQSLFIPKKLYDNKRNKFLNFREISELPYDIHTKKFFEKHDLSIIDNTQDEIFLAMLEMNQLVDQNFIQKEENNNLQNLFWEMFKDNQYYNDLRFKIRSRVPNSFLKLNKFMVE